MTNAIMMFLNEHRWQAESSDVRLVARCNNFIFSAPSIVLFDVGGHVCATSKCERRSFCTGIVLHGLWNWQDSNRIRVTPRCHLRLSACVKLPQTALNNLLRCRKSVLSRALWLQVVLLWLGWLLHSFRSRVCVFCNNRWGSTSDVLEEVERFSWGKGFVEMHCAFSRCQTVQEFVCVSVRVPVS